jgi:tetratricopeptide (TPR) repeat protein/DNA-binding CsgD family transcriptional regulator
VTIIEELTLHSELAGVNMNTPLKTIADAHQISDTELATLSLALDGLPTAEIATQLGCSPDAVRKRLGQVYSKFEITGKGPGKLAALRYKLEQHLPPQTTFPVATSQASTVQRPRHDWGNAPRVSEFWGRQAELTALNQWIIEDYCPLVTVSGMVGVGKTSLAVYFTQQVKDEFDFILWWNLRETPSLSQVLPQWLYHFSQDEFIAIPQTLDNQLNLLIQCFRQSRCLLILDQFESLFQPGKLAGSYQQNYQDYQQLLQRVGESRHQSCVMILTQEKPLELVRLAGAILPVRLLSLTGLIETDAQMIIESILGSTVAPEAVSQLVQRYSGNPLALKTAATTIRELFNGNISQFLQHDLFLGDILTQALNQQLQRLSSLESQILYDLALYQEPVSPHQLQSHFSHLGNSSDVLKTLESLKRRSLLETVTKNEEVQWTIQPMMKQFVIHQVREKMSQFIARQTTEDMNQLDFLTDLGMINPDLIAADEHLDQQFPYSQVAKHLNKMGKNKYLSGDFIIARKYLLWAIQFNPDLATAHYNLGSTYEELEDYQSARQYYQKAAIGSGIPAILAQNNLARLEILDGNIEAAIDWINSALEQAEDNKWKPAIYKNLGWAYLMKNCFDEAEQSLQKALELEQEYASAHYLMAKVLEAKGESKKAKEFWSNALTYDRFGKKDQNSGWRLPELEGWRAMAHQRLQTSESATRRQQATGNGQQ